MREGEPGGVVSVELEDYVFVHIDERYQGETKTIHLKNGEEYELAVNEYKGKLFVKKH
ncbi:hypothetical protein [Ornithinibacillus scapharcae]|uniref:hypothetical protein n=1 Tax=Ornithinibacillus scapharcae TaxID=1147159 RepID=UPI00030EC35B|nr:hypothetical protein [Ornithinibacillus scapharcae]